VWHVTPFWLEPYVIGIHIIHFRPQEVVYHRSIALAVANARFVLEEVRTDDSARPKSTSNSDFLGMHLELVYLAWIGIVPNSTILLIHISIHPKMGLIAKDDLFGEIWVNFQLLQNPVSEHTALSIIVYLKFLGQLNFIGMQSQVPTQNSSSWSRRKAKFLWTTRNWPPRVFSYTAAMFSADLAFRRRTGADYLSNRLIWIWLPNVE